MFTTGVAAGHIDLLERVREYLVDTVGWTELAYDGQASPSPATPDDGTVKLSLRAPGALTGHEFFLNIKTEGRTTDDAYGWRMSAATDWETGIEDAAQQMASPFAYFNTWQNDIPYWIYASNRRFVLVCKVNTSYISMYAGLFLPFGLPTEYLKPFMICGNDSVLEPYNFNNSGNQFIVNPGKGNCYALNLNGDDWQKITNTGRLDNATIRIDAPDDGVVWPHRCLLQNGNNDGHSDDDWSWFGFFRVRPNANGESPQFLCHLMSRSENHMMGTLDGVYSTAGFGRTSEQELTMEDRTYRVFQNIFRTTPRDFMSVEEY